MMRSESGSVAYLKAAKRGYGIGLDSTGHRVELIGEWSTLSYHTGALDGPEPVYVELEDWQVLAVDGEVQRLMSKETMPERAAFLRSAMDSEA
jgi:hypothetical protein